MHGCAADLSSRACDLVGFGVSQGLRSNRCTASFQETLATNLRRGARFITPAIHIPQPGESSASAASSSGRFCHDALRYSSVLCCTRSLRPL